MDSVVLSSYVLLQLVLAPILYPVGYIVQLVFILISALRNGKLQDTEWMLIEPLALAWLLCNLVLDDQISAAGFATRVGFIMFRLYQSPYLQELGKQIMEPLTSCFLLVELLAAPHLYPNGYIAQLIILLYLALSGAIYGPRLTPRPHASKKRKVKGKAQVITTASTSNPSPSTLRRRILSYLIPGGGGVESVPVAAEPVSAEIVVSEDDKSIKSEDEAEGEAEQLLCKICFEHNVGIAFLNCGHMCCKKCSDTMGSFDSRAKCPFCKTSVWRKVEVFFP